MSGLRDIDELGKVAENIGSGDHHRHRPAEAAEGGRVDPGHLLPLAATQKAVRDLVSALEQDGEG